MSKKPVTISVSSVQEADGERECTTRAHSGMFYERDGSLWILYEDDGTSTTLRIGDDDAIRIHRRGVMNAWQDFKAGEMTGGLLALGEGASGEMILRVLTSKLAITRDPHRGRIELVYELFTGASGQPDADPTEISLGKFTLDMVWDALEP